MPSYDSTCNQHAQSGIRCGFHGDSLFVYMFLQKFFQVQSSVIFALPPVVSKVDLAIDEKLRVRKRIAPGREVFLIHDGAQGVRCLGGRR